MTKLYFDHTFTTDHNHKFWKKLEKYGFNLESNLVKHPDANCRFIKFNNFKYLEFVSTKDLTKFESAGFSFGYSGKLKAFNVSLIKKGIKTKFTHRNYDWATNSKDYLPGWNFVTFQKLGFKTIYPWITEYELRPGMKERPKHISKHPNGVNHIVGHEFQINDKGRQFFESLLGKKIKDKFVFKDGITLYFTKGPKNLHKNVILKADKLSQTLSCFPKKCLGEWQGQNAIIIANPCENERMWGIVVLGS
jgi:hypothetical protein